MKFVCSDKWKEKRALFSVMDPFFLVIAVHVPDKQSDEVTEYVNNLQLLKIIHHWKQKKNIYRTRNKYFCLQLLSVKVCEFIHYARQKEVGSI
jgi:uncharacterized membrane protein YbaN (DUF454 family)